jgi:hypothetical protein
MNFARREHRIAQVFENVEGENAIEDCVPKRQRMRVADDIGVAKNLVLELDAIRVPARTGASAEVQCPAFGGSQNILELCSERVTLMPAWNYLHQFAEKNRDVAQNLKMRAATLATNRCGVCANFTAALRAD